MAAIVGMMSALVAVALVWLIGTLTNLFYYHRFSSGLVSPAGNHLGIGGVLVPMAEACWSGCRAVRLGEDPGGTASPKRWRRS